MIDYDESSDLDGPAHRLVTCHLMSSRLIQPRSCCSSTGFMHSICSRLKAWEEGECVEISLSNSWTLVEYNLEIQPTACLRDSTDIVKGIGLIGAEGGRGSGMKWIETWR